MTSQTISHGAPEAEAYDAWAPYYDVADADRAPFVAFYASLVDGRCRSLVELGCGTGTLLAALAERIVADDPSACPRVVGVDASRGMLAVAAARYPAIEWRYGDIRRPPLDGRFDLVFSGFNTLQHLLTDDDLLAAFAAARAHVADGGRFAFDIYQPNLAYLSRPAHDRLARSLVDADGRALEIREDAAYDADAAILTLDWRLVPRDAPGAPPLATTRYRLRQHFPADVQRLLAASGWRIAERHGDFDRSTFGPASRKQVVVCAPA